MTYELPQLDIAVCVQKVGTVGSDDHMRREQRLRVDSMIRRNS